MEVIYSINGKYFKTFGVYISESKGLLDKLKPKPRKSYDWAEYHGKVVDLSAPKYEEREITLTGWIEGENWQTMKQNFDTLLSEFDKGGLVRLLVEFGKELMYDVYLDGAVELEKSFKEGEIIGKFSLKLKEPNPVKKVLKLVGSNLSLSFNSEDWVEVNIDGNAHSYREQVSINKELQNRNLISVSQQGRNLLLNSKNDREVHRWETYPETYIYYDIVGGALEPNTEYTLTWEYITIGNIQPMMAYFVSNVGEHRYIAGINHSNTWTKKQWTFRTGNNPNQSGIIRFDHKGSIDGQNCILKTRLVKLEKGNKSTDWTPAPEETHYITIAGNIDKIKNLQTNAEEIW